MAVLMKKSDIIQFPYHFLIFHKEVRGGAWIYKTFFSEIGIEGSLKFLDRRLGNEYSANFDAEDPNLVFLRSIETRAFRDKENWK